MSIVVDCRFLPEDYGTGIIGPVENMITSILQEDTSLLTGALRWIVRCGRSGGPSLPDTAIYKAGGLVIGVVSAISLHAQPESPQNASAEVTSASSARVSWVDVSKEEDGFRIWRIQVSGLVDPSGWYLAGEVKADRSYFEDGGLSSSSAYEYKLAAFNTDGESAAVFVPRSVSTPEADRFDRGRVIAEMRYPYQPNNPSCVRLEDGTLLLAYHRARVMHWRKYAQRIVMRTSVDNGTTWTEEETMLSTEDQPLVGTGKPALVVMDDGRLGMTFSRWHFNGTGNENVVRIDDYSRLFTASDNLGKTWSDPVLVSDEASAKNHSVTVGDNGRIIQALGNGGIVVSDDHGATWRQSFKIEALPGMGPIGESSVAYAGEGRLIWIGRHEAPFYPVSRSIDNGETWGPVQLLYCGGGDNPPAIAAIPGTEMVVALIHSWYDGQKRKDRRQLAAYVSYNLGRTWSAYRQIEYNSLASGYQQPAISFFEDSAYIFFAGGIGAYGDADEATNLKFLKMRISEFEE